MVLRGVGGEEADRHQTGNGGGEQGKDQEQFHRQCRSWGGEGAADRVVGCALRQQGTGGYDQHATLYRDITSGLVGEMRDSSLTSGAGGATV